MNKKALIGFLSTIIITIICISTYAIINDKNSLFESDDTVYELQDQEEIDDDSYYENLNSTSYEIEEAENTSNTTGRDWVNLSFDDKLTYVQTVIDSMESSGRSVTADAYWFIDALNAYYGSGKEANASDNIVDIIVMSGVSGGVIK